MIKTVSLEVNKPEPWTISGLEILKIFASQFKIDKVVYQFRFIYAARSAVEPPIASALRFRTVERFLDEIFSCPN